VLEESGVAYPVVWPSEASVALGSDLAPREEEREVRAATLRVHFADDSGNQWWWDAPDEPTYGQYPVGGEHRIRIVRGEVVVLGD
jgi:hypothetical protein